MEQEGVGVRRVACGGMGVFAAVLSGPHPLIGQLPEPGAAATAPNPLSDTTVSRKSPPFRSGSALCQRLAAARRGSVAEWFADDAVALNNGAAPLIGKSPFAKSGKLVRQDYQLHMDPYRRTDGAVGRHGLHVGALRRH